MCRFPRWVRHVIEIPSQRSLDTEHTSHRLTPVAFCVWGGVGCVFACLPEGRVRA